MAITAKMEGKKLVITADVDGTEMSGSGKNINRATTGGFVTVDGTNLRFGLNVIEKPAKKK
jgi:hypothetical protein